MNSELYKLNVKDIGKGLLIAVLAAVFAKLGSEFNLPGFEVTTLNWGEILNIGVLAGISYLTKNLFTDGDGKVLGHWG